MLMYLFHVKTQKRIVIELMVTANSIGEVVQVQNPDGSNAWHHLGDLIRAGYVDRVEDWGRPETYRVRRSVDAVSRIKTE